MVASLHLSQGTSPQSKNFEAFNDWRNAIVSAVKKAAREWCGRIDGNAVVHYIDSGPGPWSLLLREGWRPTAIWGKLRVGNLREVSVIVNMPAAGAT